MAEPATCGEHTRALILRTALRLFEKQGYERTTNEHEMGVVLYSVRDRAPGTAKTHELIDRTVPLFVRLIGLARYRVMRGVLDDVVDLVRARSGQPA